MRRQAVRPTVGADEALADRPRLDVEGSCAWSRAWAAKRSSERPCCAFLPFFRMRVGLPWVLRSGTEERRRTVGSAESIGEPRPTRSMSKVRMEKSFDRTYPALDVAEWGVQKRRPARNDPIVALRSAEDLKIDSAWFSHQLGPRPRSRSVRLGAASVQGQRRSGWPRPQTGALQASSRPCGSGFSVIYYPLWVVRYRFRKRAYQVLVDAEDGSVAYGKAPGNDLYRALMLVATEAVAAFVGTTAIQLAGGRTGVLLIVGGLGLALVIWGWKRFRYGGVVIEGSGVAARPSLGRSLRRASHAPFDTLQDIASGRFPGGSDR